MSRLTPTNTTDGFVTDATLDVVASLDLYGLAPLVRQARLALTGEPTMWSAKHYQEDLLNGTTRLNISRRAEADEIVDNAGARIVRPPGVLAHGGFKVPDGIKPDSQVDRDWMWDTYVHRTSPVPNGYSRFTPFRFLSRKSDRKDFIAVELTPRKSMDFDFKRQPIEESLQVEWVPDSEGVLCEVAYLETRPWDTVADMLRAKALVKTLPCLRTEADWRTYFVKWREGSRAGRRIPDLNRAVLMSIVIGHRREVWDIPNLRPGRHLDWRLSWLAAWGLGEISESSWKNARRRERETQMLPREDLEPWLSAMCETREGVMPPPASS